ncbi:MAG: carboxypeptidase regulatory-like domain-containing protein, partial [Bryobacterales bacterium]|nr:carboxypeptidase regulatory-like domain-containing protein [Bryobacterales bacterium]
MTQNDRRVAIARLLPLLLCVFPWEIEAQELRGRIQGVVSDGAGGVIPGANVTLTNMGTAVESTTQSNASGQYIFDFVLPGNYHLTVQADGFRTFVQENIRVQTRADITVDAPLEIGAVTESITVTEAPVAVKFTTTTMETTLDTKMTEELPMIHRHPLLLAMIDPQVVYTSGSSERSAYHHWAGSRMDVGGGTELKNEILVDGSSNTWGPKTNYVPTMDSVSELNVQQNPTDAEFGHSAGGVLSLQMKSGTNEFHGTAYYFGRNPKLNARADSFNNSPSVIRRNVWGFTSGNPIIKNKLFSFVSYEGQDERSPANLNVTLPTTAMRSGDFSNALTAGGAVRPIYDPMTTTFLNGQVSRTQFVNNAIPQSRIDATSARLLQDVWEPNRAGDNLSGIFNYRNTYSRPFKYINLMAREDWNVNDNLKVFGRWSRFHTTQTTPLFTNSPAQGTGGSERNSTTLQGDAVWTINPTTVFNIRGSWNRPVDRYLDPDSELDNYDAFWPGNNWYDSYAAELPQNYYPGYLVQVPGNGSSFGRRNYWFSAPYFWNLSSKLSMQKGKHYVKFGGEYRKYIGNTGFFQPFQFQFSPALTADTFINPDTRASGDAWATMLLGAIGDDSRIQTTPLYKGLVPFYGFFLHDDFKATQRVTFNLGIRFEYDGGLKDTRGRLSRQLDLTDPIPELQGAGAPVLPDEVLAIRGGAPSNTGAWNFTSGPGQAAYDPPLMVMPRIGMAYRVSDRTAIRIGYGRYYIPTSINNDGGINLNDAIPYAGFEQDSNSLPILEGVPQAFLSDPFPAGVNPLTPPPGKSLGRYTALGNTGQDRYFTQNPKAAYNDRINFSLQRQVMAGIVLDFTYFISRGGNHQYQYQPNLLDPRLGYQYKSLINQQVDNPYYNFGTPETF